MGHSVPAKKIYEFERLFGIAVVCRSSGINRPYRYENELDRDRTPTRRMHYGLKIK